MEDVSVKLYKYMCDEVIGFEKVFNYRRQFFNVHDDVCNHCGNNNWNTISSGRKAEGCDLPGSDYDLMYINKDINVDERDDVLSIDYDLRAKDNLVLDIDNAMPGFTLLCLYDVREWTKNSINVNDNGVFFIK